MEVLLQDLSLHFLRLDGSTPVSERQSLIHQFSEPNSRYNIFLLSTKAGGLGINLTAADTVILHDLDFNPENDRQAEDRAHRIGQTKDVKVIKLITKKTVDEDIFLMGERKKKLNDAVLSNKTSNSNDDEEDGKKKKGGKKKNNDDEDDDEGTEDNKKEEASLISQILTKALKRR